MKTKFRNHPSLLIEQMGKFWITILVLLILNLDMDEWKSVAADIRKTGDFTPIITVLIIAGLFLLFMLLNVIRWYKTWITIDDTSITITVNTINQSSNTIGLKNISNVTLQRSIFEMLIGTAKVKIDTDSRSTAESTDMTIVLKKDIAEQLRQHLMSQAREDADSIEEQTESDATAANPIQPDEPVYDVYYDNKKILIHCLYTAPITGILISLGGLIALIIFIREQLLQNGWNLQTMTTVFAESFFAGGTILLFYLSAAYSLIKDFFKFYHFRAQRIEDRIRIEFGMFERNSYEVPVSRINSIVIQKSLISRLTKRCCVDLINVGIGDEKEESTRLLLSIPDKHLAEILHRVLPEFDDYFQENPDAEQICPPKKIWWKHGFGACKILLIAVIAYAVIRRPLSLLTGMLPILYWLAVLALIAFYLIGCYGSYRASKLQLHTKYLAVSSGVFATTTRFVRYHKIQYMNFTESPTERLLHLQQGSIYILASAQEREISIPSLEKKKIEELIPLFIENGKRTVPV